MKFLPTLIAAATFAACGAATADSLLLRIQQTDAKASADFQLTHAQKGDFAHHPLAETPEEGDLIIIGRDKRGNELFRTAMRDPGVLHAESFNPDSGEIEHAEKINLGHSVLEIRVPYSAELDSVEIVQQPDGNGNMKSARTAKRFDLAEIDAALEKSARAGDTLAKAGVTSTLLHSTGPSSNRMDFILIGDGYTAAEMSKWATHAQSIANGLLNDPLFKTFKQGMNIRRVDIASAQSGVSEPDRGITRNTALGMTAGCYGIERLVCVNDRLVYNALSGVTSPDGRDVIIAIANTTRYGGAGGTIATFTMHPQSVELALHEIGHTAFKLADEYDYGTCDTRYEPTEANVTTRWSRTSIKWADLIASTTPVPTPTGRYANGTVGLFTGGKYCTSGMYRPTENSRMRTLGYPWHAVNERRVKAVVAQYYNPSNDNTSGDIKVNGSLGWAGASSLVPSPAHQSASGGTFRASLTGPSDADFELALFKWNGSAWTSVASSTSPTSNESLSYDGSAGYYYLEVKSYSGTGNFTVTYNFPK